MGETPEDVAVLYSWANLHGAKYRDFSASRREYRAQLRHRAAEQAREQELRAQADAEAAASIAEGTARQAEHAARLNPSRAHKQIQEQAEREAAEAAQLAGAERIEAARRAEAAALAEAAARREEREMAEAAASARRQAARYADSEIRRRQEAEEAELPGQMTDPYTTQQTPSSAQIRGSVPPLSILPARPVEAALTTPKIVPASSVAELQTPVTEVQPAAPSLAPRQPLRSRSFAEAAPDRWEQTPSLPVPPTPPRRPRGYRPDDASGVRQIYRGPEFDQSRTAEPIRQLMPTRIPASQSGFDQGRPMEVRPQPQRFEGQPRYSSQPQTQPDLMYPPPSTPEQASQPDPSAHHPTPARQPLWGQTPVPEVTDWQPPMRQDRPSAGGPSLPPQYAPSRVPSAEEEESAGYISQTTPGSLEDPGQRRRRQDFAPYQPAPVHPSAAAARRESLAKSSSSPQRTAPVPTEEGPSLEAPRSAPRTPQPAPQAAMPQMAPSQAQNPQESATPAWLYASQNTSGGESTYRPAPQTPQSSVADTLQQSRERVASRWFALKGVFEQPGQDRAEAQPVRQKETRTPVLAVFSLAGGVGKTSLVATLGRSLYSLGEKVLLTDTTSHGLLPFYFGASELRQGTVRTFSPPSGSTDAPIYLVSYDVEERSADEASQDQLVDEINGASRGTHRVLLDLTANSGWVARRMARHKPTILVPVAPDMNSVISLQGVEKFFNSVSDPDGKPLQIFYILNQFDASLPLHLDVREVLRRQLGERLLPTVIRRAPAVSEALAEGMTIIDYSPEAPVAEDYLSVASWLRALAAPATAGFRNVRWSER